jgi:hypothetical protein
MPGRSKGDEDEPTQPRTDAAGGETPPDPPAAADPAAIRVARRAAKARGTSLSPEQRREIGRKAAKPFPGDSRPRRCSKCIV